MYYEVVKTESKVGAGPDDYYLLVNFWYFKADATKPPIWINDFHIRRKTSGIRIVRNGQGFLKTKTGTLIDPDTISPGDESKYDWELEPWTRDLRPVFEEVIVQSWDTWITNGKPKIALDSTLKGDGVSRLTIASQEVSR